LLPCFRYYSPGYFNKKPKFIWGNLPDFRSSIARTTQEPYGARRFGRTCDRRFLSLRGSRESPGPEDEAADPDHRVHEDILLLFYIPKNKMS
jgi:hypothetical protein